MAITGPSIKLPSRSMKRTMRCLDVSDVTAYRLSCATADLSFGAWLREHPPGILVGITAVLVSSRAHIVAEILPCHERRDDGVEVVRCGLNAGITLDQFERVHQVGANIVGLGFG